MRIRLIILAFVLGVLFLPHSVAAQSTDSAEDQFQLRVNGQMTVPATDTVDDLVVISGNAQIDGVVRNSLVVVDGNAIISGRIEGDLTVVSGELTLLQGASVENISLINSSINRAEGVAVSGTIHDDTWSWAAAQATMQVFSVLLWVGMTLAAMLAVFVFARFGRRQLEGAVSLLHERSRDTALAALILWIGVPILAFVAIVTVIGLPTGLAVQLFVLPALWFLGYLVFGTWFGTHVLRLIGQREYAKRPVVTGVVGVVLLQVIALIPIVGVAVLVLGGAWGAGALVLRVIRIRSREETMALHTPVPAPV